MRYSKQYNFHNIHQQQRQRYFDIAQLDVQLQKVKAMGVIKELSLDTLYITDKALDISVGWEKWFVVYLKGQYKYILSSPQVWRQILCI